MSSLIPFPLLNSINVNFASPAMIGNIWIKISVTYSTCGVKYI